MIVEGYGDCCILECCIQGMEKWLVNFELLEVDVDVEYAVVIDIDLVDIKELILCVLNDLDDVCLLFVVQGEKIDEVFIGFCMINIGYFCAVGKLLDVYKGQLLICLWVVLLICMDVVQLIEEGYYSVFGKSGVCIEIFGCFLCMGNQVCVVDGVMVVFIFICNFLNCLGIGVNVFLVFVELAVVAVLIGKLLMLEEYQIYVVQVDKIVVDIYCYLNFNQFFQYIEKVDGVIFQIVV